MRRANIVCGAVFLLICLSGCSNSAAPDREETKVREAWTALQGAIKAKDGDKIWNLLDADSKAAAERAAKAKQAAYEKASAEEKSKLQEQLGLSGAALAGLKGPGFVGSKLFHGKWDEVPDSKLTKVTVRGERAELAYHEPDGDDEKLTLVRQEGAWKFSMTMP